MKGTRKRFTSRRGILFLAVSLLLLLSIAALIGSQSTPSRTSNWMYSADSQIVLGAVNRDGTTIAVAIGEEIILFNREGIIRAQWTVPQPILSVALSVDGSRVLVSDIDTVYHFSVNGTLVWKISSLIDRIDHLSASEVRRETVAFSHKDHLYSILCDDCSTPSHYAISLGAEILNLKVSADGFFILASTNPPDNSLYLFERGLKIRWQKGFPDEIRGFDFSDDAAFIAVCTEKEIVAITRTGSVLWNRTGEDLTEVEVSNDRTRVLAIDSAGQLMLIDTFTGQALWNYKAEAIKRAVLTSDGKHVAAIVGNQLCFLDSTKQTVPWCHRLTTPPNLLAMSADASIIITTDSERRLIVFLTPPLQQNQLLESPSSD